ncbi:hypothetical protein HY345_01885 [Candidatus Microgenomates bacterium]|nr:hypothetical protein [Candidatus Microgenomates bacterium]
MKRILIIIFCFSLGVISAYFFILWQNKKEVAKIVSFLPEKITPSKSAFSLENAPTESLKATISSISGEILWQSRTATEPGALLSKDLPIQQGEKLIASKSGSLTLNFDLAGELSLFPNTEIEIVQTLPVNLVFKQTQGVVDYESKANTFAVLINRLLVSFSNAAANVSVNDTTGVITVKVYRGQVTAAYNDKNFLSQRFLLQENDRFIFDNEKRQGEKTSF